MRTPIFAALIFTAFSAPANAATIQYSDGSDVAGKDAFLGYTGRVIAHYTKLGGSSGIDLLRYEDIEVLPYGSSDTDSISVSASGSYSEISPDDSYGYANADFSAMTGSGFSMTGSVAAVGVQNYTDQYSQIDRTFGILLTETTQLKVTAEWSNLVDSGAGNSSMNIVIADDIYCAASDNCVNEYNFGFSTASGNPDPGVAGIDSQVITLGPGQYTIGMFMSANEVGSGAKYQSFDGGFSVSVVPVPAAVWLLGSALVGLGWFRRTQSA